MTELGDSLGIVSAVYLAILIPWAFLYYHDFISERWTSIRKTFRNGIIHIVVVFVPMPLILYYIILQQALTEPDYKEMFAGIAALVLSIYHLVRTVWGLVQLYQFRKWAINTSISLESASYKCRLNVTLIDSRFLDYPVEPDEGRPSSVGFLEKSGGRTPRNPFRHRKSASLDSIDHVRQFDSVPEEFSKLKDLQVPARCEIHYNPNKSISDVRRIVQLVDRMKVNSSIVDNEIIGSSAPHVSFDLLGKLQPRKPEATFVRWTVAYLAQFGKRWIQDSRALTYGTDSWEGRRQNFAAKVWGTAVLRMETECVHEPRDHRITTNVGQSCFLGPEKWHDFQSSMRNQLFDKHKVLKKCFLKGAGLPYNKPVMYEEDSLPSHGLYKPLIKEAISQVPTYLYEFVEELTPAQVEWFAIFIGISEWCGCHAQACEQLFPISKDFDIYRPRKCLKPSDAPVRILQSQLGLSDPPIPSQCGFPFMTGRYGKYLWDNRGILQVSARIDNWLALSTGHQVEFLLKNQQGFSLNGEEYDLSHAIRTRRKDTKQDLDVGFLSQENLSGEGNTNDFHDGSDGDTDKISLERSQRIFQFHGDLESNQLRYQLANYDAQHSHLQQSLTFMGCVTESVRSEIADFCYQEEDGQEKWWFPNISKKSLRVTLSQQLWSCLMDLINDHGINFDSTIQERLLWECQNGIHSAMQDHEEESYKGVQCRLEAMLLLLLGFPSLRVEHSKEVVVLKDNSISRVFFRIWPVAGPQPFKILINLCQTSPLVDLNIVVEGDGNVPIELSPVTFIWQDWRDAFEGRLHGRREWQRNHYMKHVRVHNGNKKISRGVVEKKISSADAERTALVWEGWWPFRAGMAFFELKHSSLIIVGDQMPLETHSLDNRNDMVDKIRTTRYGPAITYEEASISELSDASLHLDAILKLSSSLIPTRGETRSPSPPPLWLMISPRKGRSKSSSGSYGSGRSRTKARESQLSLGDTSDEEDIMSTDVELSSIASTPSSPESSRDNLFKSIGAVGFTNFNPNPTTPAVLLKKVQEQDPLAMHDLAKAVLTGSGMFRKNRPKALLLMERAIVLGRRIETVEMFVNSILDYEKNQAEGNAEKNEVDVDRALKAVELLWRDIDARHIIAFENGKAKRIWNSEDKQGEANRMKRLTKLHLKLIKVRRTGELMRYLANRLWTWGKSEAEREVAIVLFESAILANRDLKAMVELALMFAARDIKFAVQMYKRVERLTRKQEKEEVGPEEAGETEWVPPGIVREAIEKRASEGHENAQILLDGIGKLPRRARPSLVDLFGEAFGDGLV
ncbi:unnamed protein product [Agarophyton chilense]|eukprot:gb/GEZJ01001387.1/.p1 GENE.gb/GEZJ01001387.1/~~gb/GEZJ01001387.1/.p1  ORF type:complete len:1302 (-),score=153.09 gb/GEZJ01001387.1/:16670-20575(-)